MISSMLVNAKIDKERTRRGNPSNAHRLWTIHNVGVSEYLHQICELLLWYWTCICSRSC